MKHIQFIKMSSAAFIIAVVAFLAATGWRDNSNSAPPRVESTIQLPEKASTITVPISIDLDVMRAKANSEAPVRLYAINENRDACVPAKWVKVCVIPKLFKSGCAQWLKTKITPDIDCHLDGYVDRGQIDIKAAENGMRVSVPLNASVTVRGRGDIGKNIQETASGSLLAFADIAASITPDWRPQVSVTPDFTWKDKAHLDVLGIRITVTSNVEPEIQKAMRSIGTLVDARLSELDFRLAVEKAWKDSASPIKLNSNPDVWLRFIPETIGFSGLSAVANRLEMTLAVTGKSQVFIGRPPPQFTPAALPMLGKTSASDRFSFYLPVFSDYTAAEIALKSLLDVGKKKSYILDHVGNISLTVDDVTVYPTSNNSIAVGLRLNAEAPNRLLDTKGTIWMTGKLAFDNDKKRIYVVDLSYGATTDNEGTNLLVGIARLKPIRNEILKALDFDFSKEYEKALEAANTAINRGIGDELFLEGVVDQAGVDEVKATAYGIYTGLEVEGSLRVRTRLADVN